ncbi:MAG: undecaprenyl/decaprenyl-phosphate alpha-N-acetylglucosaminyl 1-phosphate transferase [Elusimicrobia bacterium]|nr:undecaprenyl/decaprenyl-phosphate alpha-N-acetylglucosaminyl 1-phosphate transferase [Elusimicrobiota bacterium]
MAYLGIVLVSFLLSLALTPVVRILARRTNLYDLPDQALKTHAQPTPRLGGVAIFLAIMITLVATRLTTHYPTGTIRNFRYILLGSIVIFILGLIDDIKPGGVRYKWKFLIQFLAAGILLAAAIQIQFLQPAYLAALLSLIWVVGITNSINLIDILDGLAATQVAIAAASFLAIGFPSEDIYVNILAAAILGATLGFLPFNLRSRGKLFMGDAGSLTLGYFLAVLALGCSYSFKHPYAVYAPILILGVPIFETLFLMYIRVKQGLSPFRGSHDHVAHRLQATGLSSKKILLVMGAATTALSLTAFWISRVETEEKALTIYTTLILSLLFIAWRLTAIKMNRVIVNQ